MFVLLQLKIAAANRKKNNEIENAIFESRMPHAHSQRQCSQVFFNSRHIFNQHFVVVGLYSFICVSFFVYFYFIISVHLRKS